MVPEKFLARLTEESKRQGMTQKTLARAAGVDYESVGCYLSGRVQPSLLTLFKLAEALDVDADYLMGFTDERQNFLGYTNQPANCGHYVTFLGSEKMAEIIECCSILSSQDQDLVLAIAKRLAKNYECP